jgi:lycopene beta-cyclase
MALAVALAERQRSVVLYDPAPTAVWSPTYGVWRHETQALGLCDFTERTWSRPMVMWNGGARTVDGVYATLDNPKLHGWLHQRFTDLGGRVMAALVPRAATGADLGAKVVIDATGFQPRSGACWQTAYGVRAKVDGHPFDDDSMLLMDFRGPRRHPAPFLYALPEGPQTIFLEETVLSARPAVDPSQLEGWLRSRLSSLGIRVREVVHTERVRIPMGSALPRPDSARAPFGAAAGLVHPSTGYTVMTSFALAPTVAEAIDHHLDDGGPASAQAAVWQALLPWDRRLAHAIAVFGHDALLGFDSDALGAFMGAFFSMPTPSWRSFVSGTATPCARLRAMCAVGQHLKAPLLARVLSAAVPALPGPRLLAQGPRI